QLPHTLNNSGLYNHFVRGDDSDLPSDEKIWQELFQTIIMPDPALNRVISGRDNYTLGGVERMQGIMEETFKNFYASADDIPDALRTLRMSMEKAQELYFRLLWLPVQLVQLREREIDEARARYTATAEERNPNLRFVENAYVEFVRGNESINDVIDRYGRNMTVDDEPMLRALLRAIMASDIYKEYMEFPTTDFVNDCEFWKNIYKHVIFVNPDFLEALEEKSVFWNDDIDTIGTFVLKTVKRIADKQSFASIMTPYKDEEDAVFGAELFQDVVKNKEELRTYINEALDTRLWDADRLAFMDIVILMTAIAEIQNFPKIPLQVSIN
ncbi:MAG: transcription antitermination protein NusB, partial [Muribaculaceae bacterium]|nr:transcription antitermination protein NusB [Muribaculaceae bacterium]